LILKAIEASGARIIVAPDPCIAPFEIRILAPSGEVIDLICYAFTANRYLQGGRPKDEHRFQVKYGSEFTVAHHLHIARAGQAITLFFGVGVDEDEGIFVACDPAMHTPTWFSSSVEFKTSHVEAVRSARWVGWERERADGRRRAKPFESLQTEILLGFTPENFLRYVQLERAAFGLDPGMRHLAIERMAPGAPPPEASRHLLEAQFDLSKDEILDLLTRHFRLAAAVRGAVAELKLEAQLRETPGIDAVRKIDEDGRPDFEVVYKKRKPILIECKNTLKDRAADGSPKVDFQKSRASRGDPCSRYYKASQFQVLAACLFPVRQKWEFTFCETRSLQPHQSCVGRLTSNVCVRGDFWSEDVGSLLEKISL
jgi:hypothetical protein